MMEMTKIKTVIESTGDRHDVSLHIGPDSIEVRGGFTPEIGPEDEVEHALTQAGDALKDIVKAIGNTGILVSVAYEDGDTVVSADVTLTDGRRLRVNVHTDGEPSVTAILDPWEE